eukprot:6464436-Amphidinium_carterae.1
MACSRAGPPGHGNKRYEFYVMAPKDTHVQKIVDTQKCKDAATRKRLEIEFANPRSMKKNTFPSHGIHAQHLDNISIPLICYKCWEEHDEAPGKYSTEIGRPHAKFKRWATNSFAR